MAAMDEVTQAKNRVFTYGSRVYPTVDKLFPALQSIGFVITADEMPDGARGLSDLHRPNASDLFELLRLLSLLRDESKAEVDTPSESNAYFCRIPDVGIFVWITLGSEGMAQAWSNRIYLWLKKRSGTGCKKGERPATAFATADNMCATLNGCFHRLYPRDGTVEDPHLLMDLTYDFVDTKLIFKEIGKKNLQPGDDVDAIIQEICLESPRVLLNPFMAFDVRRVYTPAIMLQLQAMAAANGAQDTDLSWLVYGSDTGIFQSDGILHVENIPDNVCVFKMSTEALRPLNLFPDILPDAGKLREMLSTTPEMADFIRTLPDKVLMERCLNEPVPDDPSEPRIYNPLSKTRALPDPTERRPFSMPYLKTAANLLKKLRNTPGVTAEAVRAKTAEVFASAIRAMINFPHETPHAIRAMATSIQHGLSQVGLHWLPAEDRACKEESAAYMAYMVLIAEAMGATIHHTTILWFSLPAALTVYVTSDGGVHTLVTGYPGDGKSYFFSNILSKLLPGMQTPISFSEQSFYDSLALEKYLLCALWVDEFTERVIGQLGVEFLKSLLSGISEAHRATNTDYATGSKKSSNITPAPLAFMGTSNKDVGAITYDSEKDNLDGVSALRDRVFGRILPLLSELDGDFATPALISRYKNKARQETVAGPACLYISICAVTCLFINMGLIDMPNNLGYDNMVDSVLKELRKSGKDTDNKNRVRMAIQNLTMVFCVMRNVYERCVQGGDARENPSLEYLCEILSEIAPTLVPCNSDIVTALSLIIESLGGDDQNMHLAQNILDKVTSFNVQQQMFVIDDVERLARKCDKAEEQMRKDLNRLTESVVGYTEPGNQAIRAATLIAGDPRLKTKDEFYIHPLYLRQTIESGTVHFDTVFCATIRDMHEESIRRLEAGDSPSSLFLLPLSNSDNGLLEDNFSISGKMLFSALQKTAHSIIGANDTLLIESVRKRVHLKYFEQTGTNHWMTKLMASQLPYLREEDQLIIQKSYFDMFSGATKKMSKTAQIIAKSVRHAGVYPLCVPSPADVRLPEFVEIQEGDTSAASVEITMIDNSDSAPRQGRAYKRLRVETADLFEVSMKSRLADYGYVCRSSSITGSQGYPSYRNLLRKFGCDRAQLGNIDDSTRSYTRFNLRNLGGNTVLSADEFISAKFLANIEREAVGVQMDESDAL